MSFIQSSGWSAHEPQHLRLSIPRHHCAVCVRAVAGGAEMMQFFDGMFAGFLLGLLLFSRLFYVWIYDPVVRHRVYRRALRRRLAQRRSA